MTTPVRTCPRCSHTVRSHDPNPTHKCEPSASRLRAEEAMWRTQPPTLTGDPTHTTGVVFTPMPKPPKEDRP